MNTGYVSSDSMEIPKYLQPVISVKLSDPRCRPLRAHASDAGADLFSRESKMIYPGDMHLLDTGVSVAIPVGFVGLVVPRSSQGKIKVYIANTLGVIDSEYRGNILVRLLNEGEDPYEVNAYSTRICQLLITPVLLANFEDYTGKDWNNTVRGLGGFGSTNV